MTVISIANGARRIVYSVTDRERRFDEKRRSERSHQGDWYSAVGTRVVTGSGALCSGNCVLGRHPNCRDHLDRAGCAGDNQRPGKALSGSLLSVPAPCWMMSGLGDASTQAPGSDQPWICSGSSGLCKEDGRRGAAGSFDTDGNHRSVEGRIRFCQDLPTGHVGGVQYVRALKVPLPQSIDCYWRRKSVNRVRLHSCRRNRIGVGGELLPKEALHLRQADRIQELANRFLAMVKDARALREIYY